MSTHPEQPPSCDYCGLPIPLPWRGRARPESGPAYCCFGCRFAAAVTQARGEQGAATWALTRLGLAVFCTMNVTVFTMALWSQDVYGADAGGAGPLADTLRGLFRYLCLLFALPVLVLLGGPLLDNAWRTLRGGALTTDLLLLLGVAASYLYSAVSVFRDAGPVYFEVGCMVLVLVTLGRWLEATGKLRTTAAIEALHRLLPATVRALRDGRETRIPLDDVRVGECLRVLPGERLPCDGRVRGQAAWVDEQVLTGESQPAVKEPGDPVLGGTLNLDGDLLLEVTVPARAGTLARLIDLVREALRSKGRFERLADRVSAGFLPAVMLVAAGTFVFHAHHYRLEDGILAGLAVVVIACPCALGLATPLAVWAALGQAARAQVLFRNGEALERLAAVRAFRFDKTGTLTTGTPAVAEFAADADADRAEVLRAAARLASSSTHSHAVAIARLGQGELGPTGPGEGSALTRVRTLPGRGVEARRSAGAEPVYLGSLRMMDEAKLCCPARLARVIQGALDRGRPLTCLGEGGAIRGVFTFQEQLRPEAPEAIARLREQGLDVAVLTGDHAARGAALARELGIPVAAGLLPEDKVAHLGRARQAFGPVAMVGDGLNDAPALAGSDVGIALGCGADVARDAAAVCLLGNDLRRLPWAVALARRTVRVIRQNLFWAFAYNSAGLALACSGRLNPVWAALAMALSSLLVVTNSLRLSGPPAPVAIPFSEGRGS